MGPARGQATAEELSTNGFRTVMEIDAIGTFNVSRAAFPILSKSPNANIINISATLQYGATFWQVRMQQSPSEAAQQKRKEKKKKKGKGKKEQERKKETRSLPLRNGRRSKEVARVLVV